MRTTTSGRRHAALVAMLALLATLVVGTPAHAATGTPVTGDDAMYPRVVRLAHSGVANGRLIASMTQFPAGGPVAGIHESTDGGATFHRVGAVADPAARSGLCCSTIFELPRQVGSLAEGTLLWAGSVGQDGGSGRRMSIPVWRSTDVGRTWTYLSTIVRASGSGGLWEPELSLDAGGRLVAFWADETVAGRNQVLRRAVTSDGYGWSAPSLTVAGPRGSDRPGMPAVEQLGDGSYLLAYEVCGQGAGPADCAVHTRRSSDGWSWGDPADLGPVLRTADGRYGVATPTLAVAGSRLLISTQQVRNPDGSNAPGNGGLLFLATSPDGPWTTIAAPVQVPGVAPGPCPNYSSSLAVLADGVTAVEVATDLVGGACRAFTASTRLPAEPAGQLRDGARVSLRVTTPGFTDRYLRHRDSLAITSVVSASSSALDRADGTFVVRRGLADASCWSFEASNFPGQYLRHRAYRLRIDALDGSALGRSDATFCAQDVAGGVRLRSSNYPDRYVRHFDSEVWIANRSNDVPYDRPETFDADTTWSITVPLAP